MLLGILKETAPGETRVALLPESLKALLAQGIEVAVEAGAGISAGAYDAAYQEVGAGVTAGSPLSRTLLGGIGVASGGGAGGSGAFC